MSGDAVVAAAWNSTLHPRGRDGRFIEKWGWVKWLNPLTGDRGRGQAVGVRENPSNAKNPIVTVRLQDGSEHDVEASELEAAPRPKASLLKPGEGAVSREHPTIEVGELTPEQTEAIADIAAGDNHPVTASRERSRYGENYDSRIPALDEAIDLTAVNQDTITFATMRLKAPPRVGDPLSQRGFMDTSTDSSSALQWLQENAVKGRGSPAILRVKLQPGDRALPIDDRRLLLARDSRLVVDHVEAGPGVFIVEAHLQPWVKKQQPAQLNLPGVAPEPGTKVKNVVPPKIIEPRSSLAAHTENGMFSVERDDLHSEIIAGILEGHQPQDEPTLVWMGGGPASGKSTVRNKVENIPDDIVVIDPDGVKVQLPDYQERIVSQDEKTREEAASYVHEESSLVARQARELAFDSKMNLLIDGVGDNGYERVRGKVRRARAAGYKNVVANYVTVPTDIAVERAEERAQKTGRSVNTAFLRRSHADVSRTVVDLVKHRTFDELNLWDTSGPPGSPPTLVLRQVGDEVQVFDQHLWEEFVRKGGKGYETAPDLSREEDRRPRPISHDEALAAKPGDKFVSLFDDSDVVLQNPFTQIGNRYVGLIAEDGGAGDLKYVTAEDLGLIPPPPLSRPDETIVAGINFDALDLVALPTIDEVNDDSEWYEEAL